MKKILLVLFLCNTLYTIAQTDHFNQPNIIVFMVDDMGWQDTSVAFWNKKTPLNKRYNTPNMERLAAQGMKFTQAYATPVCSPTRVSFLTGMNAARHRVTNWTLHKDAMKSFEINHKQLQFPIWNVNGITTNDSTPYAVKATPLPKLLYEKGYHTIHVGKAHFAAIGLAEENPLALGFNVNIAGHAAGAPGSYLSSKKFKSNPQTNGYNDVPGLELYHDKNIFLTEALTLEAIKAMDQAVESKKPFFLYMAHYAVHIPIEKDPRFYQKYEDLGLHPIEAKYASLVEGMDKSLGDLMDYLDQNNLSENTIILFMSDNGGLSAHARGGQLHTHNKPLASGKGSIYEGGIRVPMIAKWPTVIQPKTSNDNYVIIEDFFPTVLELAGVKNPNTIQHIDGQSFVHLLKNNTKNQNNDRSLVWHYPNNWGVEGPGIGSYSAIRQGDWKLIYNHETEDFELYNLSKDIRETHNLVDQKPQIFKHLSDELTSFLVEVDAQMPTHRSSSKKVNLPNKVNTIIR